MSKYVKITTDGFRRIAKAVREVEGTRRDLNGGPYDYSSNERRIPNQLFAVYVTRDGGSAGGGGEDCDWTYEVSTLSGRLLGTEMTPKKRRDPGMEYTETPSSTIGSAYFDEFGIFTLYDANETLAYEDCGGESDRPDPYDPYF